tara:strand:+ start:118 stop:624 length:507 start_codon:yes stop_codon:yes gene_type:complete
MRIQTRILGVLAIVVTAALLAGGPSRAAGVISEWSTDFGAMRLHVDEDLRVSGGYDHKGGQIKGLMTIGGRITAYWLQGDAGRRCRKEAYGTHYWGVVVWDLTPAGDLVGHWSYCRDAVGSGGTWAGQLEAGPSPLVLVRGGGYDRRRNLETAAGNALLNLLDALSER